MKIYCLDFVTPGGAGERIWHTNRRALERYSATLAGSGMEVRTIETYELAVPVTEARLVAFLNAHCADYVPPGHRRARSSETRCTRDGRSR